MRRAKQVRKVEREERLSSTFSPPLPRLRSPSIATLRTIHFQLVPPYTRSSLLHDLRPPFSCDSAPLAPPFVSRPSLARCVPSDDPPLPPAQGLVRYRSLKRGGQDPAEAAADRDPNSQGQGEGEARGGGQARARVSRPPYRSARKGEEATGEGSQP